jgi:hypothetical protein
MTGRAWAKKNPLAENYQWAQKTINMKTTVVYAL